MTKYLVENIDEDVMNWEQTVEELAAWTVEAMREELESIDLSECESDDPDALTLDELAELYTMAAHDLAARLKKEEE